MKFQGSSELNGIKVKRRNRVSAQAIPNGIERLTWRNPVSKDERASLAYV
jgi:hypothetical protein